MTLQQLRYFLVMAQVLHYTKAAEQLYITQPALSYAISELEKELGAPLFERQGRTTVLSKFGEEFLPHVQQALDALNEGQDKIYRMLDRTAGTINLGYIYSISFDFVPKKLEAFYLKDEKNGKITFNFFQGLNSTLSDKVLNGSLDLAFAIDPQHPSIEAVPIFEQELYAIVPLQHPLATQAVVSIAQLAEENFVSIHRNSSLRSHIDHCFSTLVGHKPHVSFEVAECNSLAAFVNSQMGIAIAPVIPSVESYQVKVLRISDPMLRRQVMLIWKKDKQLSGVARDFRDFVLESLEIE